MELKIKTREGRTLRIHPEDAQALGISAGNLARLQDMATGLAAVGVVETLPEIPKGEIQVDPVMAESIGAMDDMNIMLNTYDGKATEINTVVFGIKPIKGMDEEDALIRAREWGPSLLNYVDGMIVSPGQQFRWSEGTKLNLVVTVLETTPALSSDLVGLLKRGTIQDYRFKLITDEPPFNGILLIDLSKSMDEKDMTVRSIKNAIDYISSELKDPPTRAFLESFQDGHDTERWRGAILSALMYLVAKVARGKGERISIVLFSDEAKPIVYRNEIAFNAASGGSISPFATTLITEVNAFTRNATFMAKAITEGISIIKQSKDIKKMKMVVLLTDGYPNDPDELRQVVRTMVAPRMDVVLFVAGIGTAVNNDLMNEVASACGGEFYQVTGLDELVKWYGELARKLTVRGRSS